MFKNANRKFSFRSQLLFVFQALSICYASAIIAPVEGQDTSFEFTPSYWGVLVGCMAVTLFCSSFGTPADIFLMFLLSLIPMGLHQSIPIAAVVQGFIVLPQIPLLLRKRSPVSSRHLLIAWDEIFVLESFTLAGVQVGVAIHNFAPSGLLLLILAVGGILLAIHSFYVFARYSRSRRQAEAVDHHVTDTQYIAISVTDDHNTEQSAVSVDPSAQPALSTVSTPLPETEPVVITQASHERVTLEHMELLGSSRGAHYDPEGEDRAGRLADAAKQQGVKRVKVSTPRIIIFIGIFFVSLLLSLAASYHVTNIELLSTAWWLIWSIKLLTVLLYGFLMAYFIKADIDAYKRGDHDVPLNIGHSHEHILHMKFGKWLLECLVIGVASGIVAGSLGIAGSHLKNPMALRLGHSPSIVIANSTVMIGITSLEQFIEYALIGNFPWKAAYPLCIGCSVIAPVGLLWLFKKGRHHKIDPYLPVITGVFVALAAVAILYTRRSELESLFH